ncbi:hypothetical protein [Mucisphaera sp.]|uniref:hypothetical protein n=1 Tax=Mucisphaera sp. TaxID=2913024 RepID=UPI003D0EFE6E
MEASTREPGRTLFFSLLLAVVVALPLGLAGCAGGAVGNDPLPRLVPEGPIPILRRTNAEVGGPASAGLYVITSQRGLNNAGLLRPDQYEVDFQTEMVLLYAVGDQRKRGYWAMIRSIDARDGQYRVRVRYNTPGGVPADGRYRPFSIVVIPRSDITEARPILLTSKGAPTPVDY